VSYGKTSKREVHEGIPADRYFEIQGELRNTIGQGIQDNLLEMALRGKPRLPFYMVGRMEGQSVVLRTEKGRLRLSVDAEDDDVTQEVIYNLNEEGDGHGEHKEREEAADDEGGRNRQWWQWRGMISIRSIVRI
jgi:hypothetical protein